MQRLTTENIRPSVTGRPALAGLVLPCIVVLAAVLACLPLFEYGAPNGHSIAFNLAWLRNFSAQLWGGDLYPRWLADMNRGAGSPVFFFYAPLPFYISSLAGLPFHGSSLDVQLAAGECLLIALSGLSFYFYARPRFDAAPAMLAAVLYMLLPYHFEIDLWRRQAIGELANYIWMPAILYFTDRLATSARSWAGLAISYALLIFSHLPTALLFSPFIPLYAALQPARYPRRRYYLAVAMGLAVGIMLSAIYLLPALLTQQYISTDKLWNSNLDYRIWFLPIAGNNRSDFTDRLFAVLLQSSAIFGICWLHAVRFGEKSIRRTAPPAAFFLMSWFLMTGASQWLWEIFPTLAKVQFPWRVAVVLDLATAMMAAHTLHRFWRHRDLPSCIAVTGVCMLVVCCSFSGRHVVTNLDPLENPQFIADRDEAVRLGRDAPEYTTVWAQTAFGGDLSKIDRSEKIKMEGVDGHASIASWEPRDILLDIDSPRPAELTVRQFYFPGWQARIPGLDQPLAVHPGKHFGFVKIAIPAGRYPLRIELKPMWQETAGAAVSAAGILVILVCGAPGLRARPNTPEL